MRCLAGEGNVYQKQYPTLSWQINSSPPPPPPPHKTFYRLWLGGINAVFEKFRQNQLDTRAERSGDLWSELSLLQTAPTRRETVSEVHFTRSELSLTLTAFVLFPLVILLVHNCAEWLLPSFPLATRTWQAWLLLSQAQKAPTFTFHGVATI